MTLHSIVVLTSGLVIGTVSQAQTGPACDTQARIQRAPPANCKGLTFTLIRMDVPPVGKVVDVPNPQCQAATTNSSYATTLLKTAGAYYAKDKKNFSKYAGSLYEMLGNDVNKGIGKVAHELPGDAGNFVRRNMQDRTSKGVCATLIGVLPREAKVVGFRFVSNDRTFGPIGPCEPLQDCKFARFFYAPQKVSQNGLTAYTTEYINWSDNLQRSAEMILFYKLPKGYTVITSM